MRLGWLVALALCFSASPGSAQDRRIALAGMTDDLASALATALTPWGTGVVVAPGDPSSSTAPAPGAIMPASATEGRALAEATGAGAVVWLSESEGGWTVWVYDVADDRVMARALSSGPPFDEATVSALALSIVAMLRHGAAAPESERVREPLALAEPAIDEGAAPSIGEAHARERPEFSLEVGLGVSALATSPVDAEPRLELAGLYAPSALEARLAIGLLVRVGTGLGITGALLEGRLHDLHALARVSGRFSLGGIAALGVGADLGLRVTVLDASPSLAAPTAVARAVGLAAGWLAAGVELDTTTFWLRAGANATPWPQSYLVAAQEVLSVEPVWFFAEITAEVALP